jgi:hypothetical protein
LVSTNSGSVIVENGIVHPIVDDGADVLRAIGVHNDEVLKAATVDPSVARELEDALTVREGQVLKKGHDHKYVRARLNNDPEIIERYKKAKQADPSIKNFTDYLQKTDNAPIVIDARRTSRIVAFGNDPAVLQALSRLKPKEGECIVALHGEIRKGTDGKDVFWIINEHGVSVPFTHRSLTTYLEKMQEYEGIKTIRLAVCFSSAVPAASANSVARSLAQQVADKSRKIVIGAEGKIGASIEGDIVSLEKNASNEYVPGRWLEHTPSSSPTPPPPKYAGPIRAANQSDRALALGKGTDDIDLAKVKLESNWDNKGETLGIFVRNVTGSDGKPIDAIVGKANFKDGWIHIDFYEGNVNKIPSLSQIEKERVVVTMLNSVSQRYNRANIIGIEARLVGEEAVTYSNTYNHVLEHTRFDIANPVERAEAIKEASEEAALNTSVGSIAEDWGFINTEVSIFDHNTPLTILTKFSKSLPLNRIIDNLPSNAKLESQWRQISLKVKEQKIIAKNVKGRDGKPIDAIIGISNFEDGYLHIKLVDVSQGPDGGSVADKRKVLELMYESLEKECKANNVDIKGIRVIFNQDEDYGEFMLALKAAKQANVNRLSAIRNAAFASPIGGVAKANGFTTLGSNSTFFISNNSGPIHLEFVKPKPKPNIPSQPDDTWKGVIDKVAKGGDIPENLEEYVKKLLGSIHFPSTRLSPSWKFVDGNRVLHIMMPDENNLVAGTAEVINGFLQINFINTVEDGILKAYPDEVANLIFDEVNKEWKGTLMGVQIPLDGTGALTDAQLLDFARIMTEGLEDAMDLSTYDRIEALGEAFDHANFVKAAKSLAEKLGFTDTKILRDVEGKFFVQYTKPKPIGKGSN